MKNDRMKKMRFRSLGIRVIFTFSLLTAAGQLSAGDCELDLCGVAPETCGVYGCEVTCEPGCSLGCGTVCSSPRSCTFLTDGLNRYLKNAGAPRIQTFGWVQTGITINNHGATNRYVQPPTSPASRQLDGMSGNTYLLGTENQSDLKLSQLWFGAARNIEAKCGVDWGFRVDSVFGTDARFCQSFGDDTFDSGWGTGDYYFALTQMYAEVGNKTLKVRVGKFVTDMAYEPIAAPATYFYSHSYACYSSPLHVSGVVLDYAIHEKLILRAGWTAGYHTSFENRFEDNGFLGKITFLPTKKTSLTYNIYAGRNNGFNKMSDAHRYGRFYDHSDMLAQTLLWTWKPNSCWSFMLEGHWASYKSELAGNDSRSNTQGISSHLVRHLRKNLSVGTRLEWYNGNGELAMFDFNGQGTDIYAVTLGMNWHPTPCLNIRPELRYDWASNKSGGKPFGGDMSKDEQLTAGLGITVMF